MSRFQLGDFVSQEDEHGAELFYIYLGEAVLKTRNNNYLAAAKLLYFGVYANKLDTTFYCDKNSDGPEFGYKIFYTLENNLEFIRRDHLREITDFYIRTQFIWWKSVREMKNVQPRIIDRKEKIKILLKELSFPFEISDNLIRN